MAPFRFRLASVLRFRERTRENKRLELHDIELVKENLRSEIERLEQNLRGFRQEMESYTGKVLSVAEIKLTSDFSQALAARIRERRRLLAALENRLVAKRAEVLQANRDVKTLEQLRERRRERHRIEEERAEQKLTDEVGQRGTSNRRH